MDHSPTQILMVLGLKNPEYWTTPKQEETLSMFNKQNCMGISKLIMISTKED